MQQTVITEKWLSGIGYEVAFWNNVYRWRHTYNGLMGWSNHGKTIALEGFDANSWLLGHEQPMVLDVGAGMSYTVGNLLEQDGRQLPLQVRHVDPLAMHFNRILRRYHKPLPDIDFGLAEYLSAFFGEEQADLIVIQNALDHSSCPIKGIREALRTLRVGGVLYLNHHPNEAETEHYKGFHQYNITADGGRLVIWNKHERHDIGQLTEGFATVEVQVMEDSRHVVAVIRKTAPLPAALFDDNADRRELCEVIVRLHASQQNITRRLSYAWFNTLQCCAQALPWEWKMKLKRLIHQA